MRLALSAALSFGVFTCDLWAQTVLVNQDLGFRRGAGLYAGSYTFNAGLNHVWFDYDSQQMTVRPRATTLVYPATELFVVQPGDVLTDATIEAGKFPKLDFFAGNPQPISVTRSGGFGFYLGIAERDPFLGFPSNYG